MQGNWVSEFSATQPVKGEIMTSVETALFHSPSPNDCFSALTMRYISCAIFCCVLFKLSTIRRHFLRSLTKGKHPQSKVCSIVKNGEIDRRDYFIYASNSTCQVARAWDNAYPHSCWSCSETLASSRWQVTRPWCHFLKKKAFGVSCALMNLARLIGIWLFKQT